jgi:hypothetical protein
LAPFDLPQQRGEMRVNHLSPKACALLVLAPLLLVAGLWYIKIGMIIADYEHAKIERNCPGHRHSSHRWKYQSSSSYGRSREWI